MAARVAIFSLGLLIIGFTGGYALPDAWMSFALYHIGGLGALGLLACGAGVIASKKGYEFWRVFSFALSLAILLGAAFAYLVPPTGEDGRPAACGGSVSLLVALIVVGFWALARRTEEAVYVGGRTR